MNHAALWSRRGWLATNVSVIAAAATPRSLVATPSLSKTDAEPIRRRLRLNQAADRIDADTWEALAERAVEAAMAAGAEYADARLTRVVQQMYSIASFGGDMERLGVGVRALVNGYWGYTARPFTDADGIVALAKAAVAQAKTNATGTPRTVEIGRVPAARGRWSTPIKIDPFTVSIEEKLDFMRAWLDIDTRLAPFRRIPPPPPGAAHIANDRFNQLACGYTFNRQERVVATSDGSRFTQTLYESGGQLIWGENLAHVTGIETTGQGWERLLEANIEEQIRTVEPRLVEGQLLQNATRPVLIGRNTLVCDGTTMAALLEQTFGVATQLDRALGYEANAGGTSFITDPFGMLGTLQVASSHVTITANRSAPKQLATVQWDDEGVTPTPTSLITDGILTDFQTTRESAGWLAPYYQKQGKPAQSHGHAAAESGLFITMQHMPNLALAPASGSTGPSLDELIATVTNGILITNDAPSPRVGVSQSILTDMQARNGTLSGGMRLIRNGRLGAPVGGGQVLFNTIDLWKNLTTLGGTSSVGTFSTSQYPEGSKMYGIWMRPSAVVKGQPMQVTSHSVSAPAAVIANQAIIDPSRRV